MTPLLVIALFIVLALLAPAYGADWQASSQRGEAARRDKLWSRRQ